MLLKVSCAEKDISAIEASSGADLATLAARSSAGEFATVPVAGNSRESSLVNLLNGSFSGELVLSPYPNEPKYPSSPSDPVGDPVSFD